MAYVLMPEAQPLEEGLYFIATCIHWLYGVAHNGWIESANDGDGTIQIA